MVVLACALAELLRAFKNMFCITLILNKFISGKLCFHLLYNLVKVHNCSAKSTLLFKRSSKIATVAVDF